MFLPIQGNLRTGIIQCKKSLSWMAKVITWTRFWFPFYCPYSHLLHTRAGAGNKSSWSKRRRWSYTQLIIRGRMEVLLFINTGWCPGWWVGCTDHRLLLLQELLLPAPARVWRRWLYRTVEWKSESCSCYNLCHPDRIFCIGLYPCEGYPGIGKNMLCEWPERVSFMQPCRT